MTIMMMMMMRRMVMIMMMIMSASSKWELYDDDDDNYDAEDDDADDDENLLQQRAEYLACLGQALASNSSLTRLVFIIILIHISVWRYPKFKRNRIRNFFPIPNFSDTESETFSDTKFFRYRIRNHLKNGKVSKPRSFRTETSPKIHQIWPKLNQTVSMYHQCIFWDCFALQKLGILLLEVISVWRYPKSERNRIRNFFRYQIFPIPNPILF